MKIIIVGAGDTGWSVLSSLREQGGDDIVVVDVDEDRCDLVSTEFDVLVLEGDGTDPALLDKAQIGEADALVATTGSDPLNTVVAMLGRQAGVETVVVKLEGAGLRSACREIGVTAIVSPAISTAAEIHGTLRGVRYLDFSVAARGELRLDDLGCESIGGETIASLDLPDNVLVVAVLREDEPVFPSPDLELETSDRLLALVEGEEALESLRDRLTADEED